MSKLKNKKGFTLIELLSVVSILAILLLMAIAKYVDSTQSVKIRVFEVNSRNLISDINNFYEKKGNLDIIYQQFNDYTISLNGNPPYSTYKIEKDSNLLICTLKKESFKGNQNYIIEYDFKNQKITQKPENNLPKGATNFK